MLAQKVFGRFINNVVVFNITENIKTEILNHKMISNDVFFELFSLDPAKIIGNKGSMQGAKIVKTHDINEIIKSSILLLLYFIPII